MKTEKELYLINIEESRNEIGRLRKQINIEEGKIKEFSKKIELIEAAEKQYGICKKCNATPASIDYNGKGHYVCRSCEDSLDRYFEEEYR
ncbi:hypothetical protein MYP_681 [Sporocytophaga myxococcoides]|uniref:Uncharacterized protein n=1 Tax=Sporocytophaga myxococcoides TaxID=153721 RepID=A0A098LAI7_9BACT|nr:hypothetical protein [Sporocytophaga myxococcoides]GAL83454.1 hypothetical protein MYP_681 [Sporocytophaga myxococcoides]